MQIRRASKNRWAFAFQVLRTKMLIVISTATTPARREQI